ncbi:MAG: transposase [Azonexus sp.]|nr:transposase [Azonexus sp.]
MPRRPRLCVPEVPVHIIQRGNNRQACFFADEDYRFYLDWLADYAAKTSCQIHSYVLMTNHVHLLLSSKTTNGTGDLMKALGQRYVQYINRVYRRSGTLWEGRYRSCLTQEETYLLTCQRYIELNPVRAGMVEHPADYRWSSYRANAEGAENPLITPHPCYLGLGATEQDRLSAYRELFRHELEPGALDAIRKATNGNFALGDSRFADQIASVLGRRVTPGISGRPRSVVQMDDVGIA